MPNVEPDDEWKDKYTNVDWSSIPVDIKYIVAPCNKYATRLFFEHDVDPEFSGNELHELRQCYNTIVDNNHQVAIYEWLRVPKGTDTSPAQALVNTFLELLDELFTL